MNEPKLYSMILFISMAICLVFGANFWKSNLKITQINIEGNRIVGSNEIVKLAHIQTGILLYNVDLTTIQQSVARHYYIKDAIVERNLPNTIHIQVTERTPIALVNSPETTYLDEDGVVLPRSVSHRILDLPVISGIPMNEPLKYGTSLPQTDVREALLLLTAMKRLYRTLYHNVSEVQLRNGGDIILYSTEGGVPIIFGHGELASKLVRLETFWNTVVLTRGPQNLQYIDLRFQDQIVARWNKGPSDVNTL